MRQRRPLFLAIAILLPAAFALGQGNSNGNQGNPQAGPRPLVVMTYNIHHGTGNAPCTPPPPSTPPSPDCGLDLDGIAAVIRAEDPDVVGLQEVDRFWARSGGVDQPAYLAEELGMFYCYGANLDHQPDNHASVPHQYGTAILSKRPILECANTLLPRTGTGEQRGLLAARINVRGVPLMFLNTHLHTTLADRVVQVQAIAGWVQGVADPIVLVGDFNARPTETSLPPLYDVLNDAWVEAGSGNGYSFPSEPGVPPNRRIDYIFVSPDVTASSILVAERPQTAMASDHYPVTAIVELPGSAVGIGPQK